MQRLKISLLVVIFCLGFFVRFYRFDNPIADWHSWRQADTSAVSRNFVTNGFDLLHPKFDDLSNVPSGVYDNPNGYRFVEFPIYNVLQAFGFKFIGVIALEQWGRLVSIFASLLSAAFIYKIIKNRFGFVSGFFASFFFLFLPFNIYYSRTILPDPLMVTTILGSIFYFQKWGDSKKVSLFNLNLIASLFFIICSLLIKPYAIFFVLPIIYISYEKYGKDFIKNKILWVFALLALIPLVLWRTWILQFPEGIPQSSWLLNGNGIRFRPSFFYWIFYERLTKLILGFFGVPIFVLGVIKKYNKKDLFFVGSFILSSLIYVSVFATGNVQHDYYQILMIPSVAIILGLAADSFINIKRFNRYLSVIIFLILTILTFTGSWFYIKDYFNINDYSIVVAGKAVDKLTPKNAKIIANYNGDTSFLYQTNRKGWASFEKSVPDLIKMGASFLVLANPSPADLEIGKTYKIVAQSPQYVIFNLSEKP
jgi:hypothetical protein